VDAAYELFRFAGTRGVTIRAIAEVAETTSATVVKYFSREELIVNYVQHLADEDAETWQSLKWEIPGNAAAQIRAWLEREGSEASDGFGCALSNASIELIHKRLGPAREIIREQREGRLVHLARLCRSAGYREPELLAGKLNMLVEGMYVCSLTLDGNGQTKHFLEAAANLVESHGGQLAPAIGVE
jgi:AcrR family transcriptional regulator